MTGMLTAVALPVATVRNSSHAGCTSMDAGEDVLDISVDDLWLREWAAEGIERLSDYLAKHAAFADFLRERDDG